MPRPLRITFIVLAAVIVLAMGAGVVFVAGFDPNTLKPRIQQAVKSATGRDLALNGKIALKASLWPTIQIEDVAFSNPPGFSRPRMATLQSMELQLGLLPLLFSRIEIGRLLLVHPDILLETAADGRTNWQLTPAPAPTAAPTPPEQPAQPATPNSTVSLYSVLIQDGTMAYRDDATGKVTTIGIPRLQASTTSPDAPLHLEADAVYNGTNINIIADSGGLSRLQDMAATAPWPLKLALSAASARLTADGSMTRPLQGRGYDLALNGTIPDVAALTPLLQGVIPPPLHDVTFAAHAADTAGRFPEVSTLTLHIGTSDLGSRLPGLMLDRLDIAAAKVDQPMKIAANARLRDAPITLAGTLGTPAQLMPNANPASFPVDLTVQAAGATASAKGSIADASAMTGASIALAAQIPDLSALSPLARHPLPALKAISFQATLNDANGGLRRAAALHGVKLTSSAGDLAGDATLAYAARPMLTAVFRSSRIDLDSVQAGIDQMPALSPPAVAAIAQPAQDATPAASKPSSPAQRKDGLFPDQPLPFGLLRSSDADLKLDIVSLHSGGADYKAISTRAVLSNGKLTVNPFAADLPEGHMSGTLTVDASHPVPPVHLVLHAPGLALKAILAAIHQPAFASGNLEVYADLSGTGETPHAIAGSLDGSLGIAMANGSIDNRSVGGLLGKAADALNVLNLVGKGGASDVKCLAVRMDAKNGIAAFNPLALSSSLLTMTGAGTVNLGAETMAIALRPEARIAGSTAVIPVALSGPIRQPSVKVNDLAAAAQNAATVAGVVLGKATPLGIVAGLLGADKLLSGGDLCPRVLAAARGQAVPPTDASPGAGAGKPNVPDPGALLKNLFR